MTRDELREAAKERQAAAYLAAKVLREKAKAMPPTEAKIGDRNPDTGTTQASFPNGGTTSARLLYNASVANGSVLKASQAQGDRLKLDARSHIEVRRVEPEVVESGKIKILFSRIIDDERVFYVGGDRAKPTEILRLPVSTFIGSAFISNTGKGAKDWIAAFRFGQTTEKYISRFIQVVKGNGLGWTNNTAYADDTQYKGHGLWLSNTSGSTGNTIYPLFADPGRGNDGRWDVLPNSDTNTSFVALTEPPYLSGSGVFTDFVGGSATAENQSFYLLDGELILNPKGSTTNSTAFNPDRATASYSGSVILLPNLIKTDEFHELNFNNSLPGLGTRTERFYLTIIADRALGSAIYRVIDAVPRPPIDFDRPFKFFYTDGTTETLLTDFNINTVNIAFSNLVNGTLYICTFNNFDPNKKGKLDLRSLRMTTGATATTKPEAYQPIGLNVTTHSMSYHP